MLIIWTGVFLKVRPVIEEEIKLWASKNFGFVTPPLEPCPSHHKSPLPLKYEPLAPVMVMSVPETETKGPDHSSYSKSVSPSKMT